MSTVTFRVSEEEKQFMQSMAELHGLSLSELARKNILENLENQLDLATYRRLMTEHQVKDTSISHAEMLKELDL